MMTTRTRMTAIVLGLGLALVGCRNPVGPEDFRRSMTRQGFTMGAMSDAIPAPLAGLDAGKRLKSSCAPASQSGQSLHLCLWKFPEGLDAIRWLTDHGPDPALPLDSIRSVYGRYVVIVVPVDAPLTDALVEKINAAVDHVED